LCYSALHCIAVHCSALQCVAVRCRVLQMFAPVQRQSQKNCRSYLLRAYSVLQCVAACVTGCFGCRCPCTTIIQCVAVSCSVLQRVAVCCSVLHCDAVCCRSHCPCTTRISYGLSNASLAYVVCCSVIQCVAECSSCSCPCTTKIQYASVCCGVLQGVEDPYDALSG